MCFLVSYIVIHLNSSTAGRVSIVAQRQMYMLRYNALPPPPQTQSKGLTLLPLIMLHLIAIHLISCINVISFYIGKQLRAMIEFHSISLNKHAN